ncbi:DUF763 domain-containing protein [Elizabethkingia anophelis]|uniref:DUF763 domain-containing protein n=1 Tax=Elizabethkingia anophelis R26 TaxID=1246994 RepID=A0ABN5BP25_9FLAO|nr:DUF763 domain-containing protein [Elizabethkingia anophelis]ATC35522.1 DUF763 domain-containing protein [Elizabethkingia anophelis R26]ATC39160.1 DUF763 domain-containing protein [Elizabethkingia anophelis Ag1]ATC42841.1 DUF763 domain-containing protein [Elizabethkingia anophelis]ATC46517.1 DUF763 domain-containing protein [Elizabethkingia anophelis]ELR78658.1 hypothetical protein D505_12655 [Elizabethkingia anophelis R26]
MKRSGTADLPLHYGKVPAWLYERMSALGLSIVEVILTDYGKEEVVRRLSDPFWFQSFGAVLGMDWHSSGITTSVMGALKRAINPNSQSLGIFICGGKGKYSRDTPQELLYIADKTGLNGTELVKASKLSAKVDNTAIQDGYQLYQHNFVVTDNGNWCVIQQGLNDADGTARRYHWLSENLTSFIEEPHTGINGISRGTILNLTANEASDNRKGILDISHTDSTKIMQDFARLILPEHHDVRSTDVDLKRLGALLYVTREQQPQTFEDLLMLEGVGPRTMQSLALVSEVIHGAPSRFKDPARFSFAHGGKDGHPFPVPVKIYDESIQILQKGIEKSKLGNSDKLNSISKLHQIVLNSEKNFTPNFDIQQVIEEERNVSWQYGGKSTMGDAKKPDKPNAIQLSLF